MTNPLYLSPDLSRAGLLPSPLPEGIEERDAIRLDVPLLSPRKEDSPLERDDIRSAQPRSDQLSESPRDSTPKHPALGDVDTVVFGMTGGLLAPANGALAALALSLGKDVYLHWPSEGAIERLDAERLRFYSRLARVARLWACLAPFQRAFRAFRALRGGVGLAAALWRGGRPALARALLVQAGSDLSAWTSDNNASGEDVARLVLGQASQLVSKASPLPLPQLEERPGDSLSIRGHGIYLRLDYWVTDISGGGVGHTTYVIKALSRLADDLTVFCSRSYEMLERLGIRQVTVPGLHPINDERAQLRANDHHYTLLRAAFQALRPSFVYERICPGSLVGARLCAELGIPYIVEYNGSEIAMAKAFGGAGKEYEKAFLAAEAASFAVASLISVVSEVVRDDLVSRGVDPSRILVNPNGADPEDYAPPAPEERQAIRAELGIADDRVVIGFTGTFGGWHGIDILAEVIAAVCAKEPQATFLLVGDGEKKPLVDEMVFRHGLEERVIRTGRVPQMRGARLLQACDAFVSTHAGGIGSMRFFGSPTKIFEYMAMGQGIVATELEQIGEVLSPCLRPGMAEEAGIARAILCPPNQVQPVVDSLIALVRTPELRRALGHNARQALMQHYTWDQHVARLWRHPMAAPRPARASPLIASDEMYKVEAQRLWNQEACGSQYIQGQTADSLEWFLEHERLRLGVFYPWLAGEMEFNHGIDRDVLEIGAGIGTDLAQFAKAGARVTDLDLSAGHLALARRNLELRGLPGTFIHHDAERLPFSDASFDTVYSFGVVHHSPRTQGIIDEIWRVLRPGGKAVITVYAEESTNFWWRMAWGHGLRNAGLDRHSMGEILSRNVEMSERDVRPLVKVYSRQRLFAMFRRFAEVTISQRHCPPGDRPVILRALPTEMVESRFGWFHIVKATRHG